MLAFRRTFYIEEEHHKQYDDLYKAITDSLREILASLFPEERSEAIISNWPGIKEQAEEGIRLTVSEWAPETDHMPRLLETELEIDSGSESWRIELAVGQPEVGRVVVYEEAYWLGSGREIPLAIYPDVVRFLRPFKVENIEGFSSDIIRFRKNRVQDFISFLKSPDHQLPIVYYAVQRRMPECTQPDAERVQKMLWGLAYVVEALDRDTVDRFNELLGSHPTYFGALRLYMPYFQPSDSAWQHPFWPCKREPEEVFHELLNRVARESVLMEPNSTITSLREQRENIARNETIRLRQETLRLQSASDEAEGWEKLASGYEEQYVTLEAEKQNLVATVTRLEDEVRQLKWRLNKQWQNVDDSAEDDGREVAPKLLLSETAQNSYGSLKPDERKYWEQHILPKLLKKDLRDAQSEFISGSKNGSTFVFPRSRTHNGRRVIYYLQGEDVYVCEIYLASEHDEYSDLRTHGPDRTDYTGFQVLKLSDESEQ